MRSGVRSAEWRYYYSVVGLATCPFPAVMTWYFPPESDGCKPVVRCCLYEEDGRFGCVVLLVLVQTLPVELARWLRSMVSDVAPAGNGCLCISQGDREFDTKRPAPVLSTEMLPAKQPGKECTNRYGAPRRSCQGVALKKRSNMGRTSEANAKARSETFNRRLFPCNKA